MPYGVIAGGEDVPAAIAAVQFASGDKETAQASLKKVRAPRDSAQHKSHARASLAERPRR
eukprot:2667943-Rhodomonas_salina.2